MVEEPEEVVTTDQSLFSGSLTVLQPPPPNPNPLDPKKKKMIIGGVVFLIVLILLFMLAPKRTRIISETLPEPSPTPRVNQSPMMIEVKKIEDQVKAASPDEVLVSPPQVDMTVEF